MLNSMPLSGVVHSSAGLVLCGSYDPTPFYRALFLKSMELQILECCTLSCSQLLFFTGVIRCRALFISRITPQPSHSLRSCSSPLQTKGHRTPSSDRSKGCTDHQPKSCKGLTGRTRNPHWGCVKCDCAFVGCLPSGHLITILVSKFWETARMSSLWL
jgi:hypothetical protein